MQTNTQIDTWQQACERLSCLAHKRAAWQTPPPADEWEASCRKMDRLEGSPEYLYFPSGPSTLVLMGPEGTAFSYETLEQTAWRDASNRMKRAGDLWKKHADDVADPWGLWIVARALNEEAARSREKGF